MAQLTAASHVRQQQQQATRTNGSSSTSSNSSLYALASRVPLMKSPSVSVPAPIQLPQDLHPLPPDISAYFVYPFSLESYVLDPNTPSSETIQKLQQRHQEYLQRRLEWQQERKREAIRKMAPGWDGAGAALLVPTSKQVPPPAPTSAAASNVPTHATSSEQQQQQERTPLDDLADHLAKLEALGSGSLTSATSQSQISHQP